MQMNVFLLLVFSFTVSNSASADFANIKVIYGDDDRVDVFESPNAMFVDLAQSTAAMIKNYKLVEYNSCQYKVEAKSMVESGYCESERFSRQPLAASCSGFLVGKDTLVTAGHCVQFDADCSNNSWVFDYKVDYSAQSEVIVDKENVYKCKKIIARDLNNDTKNDFAYIQLDREVTDRKPLKYRTSGKPAVGDPLVVIGHPTGLPTKIADGATVRSVNQVFLVANLDTYGGNSGSAVFNAKTGIVEGILVRGDDDFVNDPVQNCRVSNRVPNNGGRGEDVTLIGNVKQLPGATPPPKVTETVRRIQRSFWQRLLDRLFGSYQYI